MSQQTVEQFLAQSLSDRRLTGSEKQTLGDWLTQNAIAEQQRGVIRHVAFDVARKAVADPDSANVIEWLEDVLRVVAPMSPQAEPYTSNSLATAFFSPGESCWRHIVQCLNGTRRSADLCVFTITDDRISRAILDARQRGVNVRIVTDGEKARDLGSDVQRFLEAGVPVKLADVTDPNNSSVTGHMHHKFAIFDSARLLFGSYNWTRGAATTNYEDLVEASDPRLVSEFAAEFERLWNRF